MSGQTSTTTPLVESVDVWGDDGTILGWARFERRRWKWRCVGCQLTVREATATSAMQELALHFAVNHA